MKKLLALFTLLPALALASVEVKGSGTTNVAKVNTSGSLQVNEGPSQRTTYYASTSGATTTAAWYLICESSALVGLKISQVCITVPGGATAAAGPFVITLRKNTAASSGGTTVTAEGTGADSVSKADPSSGSFPGVCRSKAATPGTSGPTIDQWSWLQSAGVNLNAITFCKNYGQNGEQLPTIPAGVANGFTIAVAAAGAGSLAVGAASMVLIAE